MAVTLDSLKKSVNKKKGKSMAFAWLADLECAAGDLDGAFVCVDTGLKQYPGDVPGMLVKSKVFFLQGKFEDCIEECKNILLKDPFCLSAQKRMGDAYDQLQNVAERNVCYRRLHDMDPLDGFWKEEYEKTEGSLAADVSGAAAASVASMDDISFDMPELGGAENVVESGAAVDVPVDAAVDAPAEVADAVNPAAEPGSIFDKSLDMDLDAPEAEEPAPSPASPVFEMPTAPASPFSPAPVENDLLAALSSLGASDEVVDESSMDDLEKSLSSAMDVPVEPSLDEEVVPAEEISGNDLDSAFSSMFGDDDDAEIELEKTVPGPVADAAEASSLLGGMDLSAVLDDEPEVPENSPEKVFGSSVVEDKPQSVDSAFNDIFGEDELPEELPAAPAAPAEDSDLGAWSPSSAGGLFEKSAAFGGALDLDVPEKIDEPETVHSESVAPAEPVDKPQSVDSAFNDIFGEDELPEELPVASAAPVVNAPVIDASAVDAPAADELDISDWSPTPSPAADLDVSLDIEPAAIEKPALEPATDLDIPGLDASDALGGGLFEKSASLDGDFDLDAVEPAPVADAVEPVVEPEVSSLESIAPVASNADKPKSVSGAFDDIFGEDELPEELPVASAAPAVDAPVADAPAVDAPAADELDISGWSPTPAPAADLDVSLDIEPAAIEKPALDPAADLDIAGLDASDALDGGMFEKSASLDGDFDLDAVEPTPVAEAVEPVVEPEVSSLESIAPVASDADKPKSVSGAFNDIFGEDELPEELPAASAAPAVDAPVADDPSVDASVAGLDELEPAPAAAPEEDGGFSVNGALDALFADDDELPEEKPVASAPEAGVVDKVIADAPAADSTVLGDDLNKDVGDAFSSLFSDSDDLDLPEEKSSAVSPDASVSTPEDTGVAVEESRLAGGSLESDLDKSFSSLFGEDDSLSIADEPAAATPVETTPEIAASAVADELVVDAPLADAAKKTGDIDSLESEVAGAFGELFKDDDSLDEKTVPPSNKGIDFLMSGDSDDEVTEGLVKDPAASLDRMPSALDDSLNTPTLAEIYFEQGLYGKAMDIYQDLARKEPGNESIRNRLKEIEKAYQGKFGGENG